jgi:mono/diheme cytochrome c family protein
VELLGYNSKGLGSNAIAGLSPIPIQDFDGSTAEFAFRYTFWNMDTSQLNQDGSKRTEEKDMKKNWIRIAKVVTVMAVVTAAGFAGVPARAQDGGAALYKTKCAACHGADAKGETVVGKADKIRDLGSTDVQQQSDADLTTIIASGKGKMPAYGKSLKPEQVKDLITYIRSFAKR